MHAGISRELCGAGGIVGQALAAASAEWQNGMKMKHALVTGAAGLIGSHVVDLLVREGWQVRALDNLEPQTHRRGKPAWINPKAEFIQGDMRNCDAITAALDEVDLVFHQAAYGGYMPEI